MPLGAFKLNAISKAAAQVVYSPGWYLYQQSTSETQANNIYDNQLAIMGYNSDNTVRAAYFGNSTASNQSWIKPILFNPATNAITFGTRVNVMGGSSGIYGLKIVSEQEYDKGTAGTTNFGIAYWPNNTSPGAATSVYPFSMDSAGAVTVGTYVTLGLSNVGTAAAATGVAYEGTYGGSPRYLMVSRAETGQTVNSFALTRSSNTLSVTRSFLGVQGANFNALTGSFAGVNDGSGLAITNAGGNIWATTFGSTNRQSASTASGLSASLNSPILITSGTSSKYMIYGSTSSSTMSSRIVNVTYSSSFAPTISLGASLYQENASTRSVYRLVKSWVANQAFLFYIDANVLYVKTATISANVITWSAATNIGALTATGLDIHPVYINANNQYFMGVAYNAGNVTSFAIRYV